LDSLTFLPESKKHAQIISPPCTRGYYNYFFNTAENLDYVGSYPEPEYYGADYMSGDERAQFLEWHKEQKGKISRNKEELEDYSMDDMNVLRQECCAFRNLFLKVVGMNPFREALTISSICNTVFRTKSLKEKTVCIIPRGRYRVGTASLLKLFNGWRTLVKQRTILFMPAMGGMFVCLRYQI
jgi:hypothetical protein